MEGRGGSGDMTLWYLETSSCRFSMIGIVCGGFWVEYQEVLCV